MQFFLWLARMLALLALPGGVILALAGWHGGGRIAHVLARGIEVQAEIQGGTRTTRRRGGTSHSINLSWKGPNGQTIRVEGVSVGPGLADQLIVDNRITRARIAIKYLPDDTENPVVLEDAAYQRRNTQQMQEVGIPLAVVGAIAAAFMLRRMRRRRAAVAPIS